MKEPSQEALMAVRIYKAFPQLSSYAAAAIGKDLLRVERAARSHAERQCSLEGYDSQRGDRLLLSQVQRWRCQMASMAMANFSLGAIASTAWLKHADELGIRITIQGDPRGRCLLMQLPGEGEPS